MQARALVRAMAAIDYESIPPFVREKARIHIRDAIGVGMAAAAGPGGAPYRTYAEKAARPGNATLLCNGSAVDAADAVLINGGLVHSIEFDDTHTPSIVHGSAVTMPVALALAEDRRLPGKELIRLYSLGYEALIRIGLAAPGSFQARGFQVTSVGGALVAAAMAATASSLDEDCAVHAVGVALSMASGSMEFLSNGSSVKSMNPGWAAHAGVCAARLCEAGLTGPETSIEGRFGLTAMFAGGEPVDFAPLGREWHLGDVAIKFQPACHYLHAFIECASRIREAGIAPSQIERVRCLVPAGAAGVVCEPWETKLAPATGHAMRWSLPGVVASALLSGVTLKTFEAAPAGEVLDVARKIEWAPLEATAFPRCYDAAIDVWHSDGWTKRFSVGDAYGNASRPADRSDIEAKFLVNAGALAGSERASILLDALDALVDCSDVRTLMRDFRRAAFADARRRSGS